MAPPPDMTEYVFLFRAVGGQPVPNSILAPRVGKLGCAGGPGGVGKVIATSTNAYAGLNVIAKTIIQNRVPRVEVIVPTPTRILKAMNQPVVLRKKGQHRSHEGNISLNDVISIAREIRDKSYSKSLQGTVLEVLGSARAMGITCNGKSIADMTAAIKAGEEVVPQE